MHFDRLGPRDLHDMRSGRGNYRARLELRRLVAETEPALRRRRHSERMVLANLKARLAQLDTRTGDPAALQVLIEASTRRLAVLDVAIVEAIVARKK